MIDIVDEVIKVIRASEGKQDSINNLVTKFDFTPDQAEAIVMMRLYSLSHQDIEALKNEYKELNENIAEYKKILSSEHELMKVIKSELKEMNRVLVCPRKTEIKDENASIKIDETDLISKEQTVVSISRDGYLKRANLKSYNASKTNGLKENDSILFLKEVSTLDTLLIFTNLGNFIYLPVYKIPETKFKDVGAFISSIVQINSKERFVHVFALSNFLDNQSLLLTTKCGAIKQTLLSDFEVSRYSKSMRAMKLSDGDELVSVDMIKNPLEILVFTYNAEVLRFRASDVSIYGTAAGGVRSINMKPDNYVVSAVYANKNDDFVVVTSRDTVKRMKVTDVPLTRRSRSGTTIIKKVKANPYYVIDAVKMTPNQYKENVQIHMIYKNGNDDIDAFSLKYNVSDAGRQFTPSDPNLKDLLRILIDDPQKEDEAVSADYLEEPKIDIFSSNEGFEEEKPLTAAKPKSNQSILDELDAILQHEANKGNTIKPRVDEKPQEEEKKEDIAYTKISLFDD